MKGRIVTYIESHYIYFFLIDWIVTLDKTTFKTVWGQNKMGFNI